tara:strand:+ start:455 stop:1126 length:672 start_codon:yes stop_codon:yes gene_type:complete
MSLTLGIDDAGRGPLIGPMVLAGVLLTSEQESLLSKENITDSKLLAQSVRVQLAKKIKASASLHKVVVTSASQIDQSLTTGTNLNTLEAKEAAEIINYTTSKFPNEQIKVVVDCPSTNTSAWKRTLISFVKSPGNLTILCEHKADLNHLSVSAASILAKVERESQIYTLKQEFGNFGSGYPSDPLTKKFLKEQGAKLKDSGLFRKTWSTWKKLFPDAKQGTLF